MIFTSKSKPLDIINFLRENYDITVNIINKNTKSILEGTLEHTKELIIDDSVKILDIRNFFSKKCNIDMEFYVSEIGKLPMHILLGDVEILINTAKHKKSLIGKIELANQMIINQKSYSDIDWSLRFLEKIILQIESENEIEALRNLLISVEQDNDDIHQKIIDLIQISIDNNNNLTKVLE